MSVTVDAQAPKQERLSTAQMLNLMRLETDQALRNGAPISCLTIGLDGHEAQHELIGRRELMRALFKELKAATFETGMRGIGVFTDRFQLSVFPNLSPENVADLAQSMVERARTLEDPRPDKSEVVTISIGVSHNVHHGEKSFEILIGDGESGMALAHGAGGDRWIRARDIESEVDQLRDELADQIKEVQNFQSKYLAEQDGLAESWGRGLIEKTLLLFEREPDQNEAVFRLKKEVIALVSTEISSWRESSTLRQMLDSQREIEMLERRVQKLTDSLGATEKELKRVAAMKSIDIGVSSIYRTVQGLADDDDLFEQKKEMLQDLFQANLDLQRGSD